MLGGKTSEEWVAQYSTSHQHPVNRLCHTFGIPIILLSLGVGVAALVAHWLWIYALGLFLFGWALQFIGHAFERKLPEFFHDWRFLFVGVRWWWGKTVGGRVKQSGVGSRKSEVESRKVKNSRMSQVVSCKVENSRKSKVRKSQGKAKFNI
jgi:hypothetical protein